MTTLEIIFVTITIILIFAGIFVTHKFSYACGRVDGYEAAEKQIKSIVDREVKNNLDYFLRENFEYIANRVMENASRDYKK